MNWSDGKDKLDSRANAILETLKSYPEGLGFNELCRKVQDKAAKETVNKRLKQLVSKGLVEKEGGDRRGQKVNYKISELAEELDDSIRVINFLKDIFLSYSHWVQKAVEKGSLEAEEGLKEIFHLRSKVIKALVLPQKWIKWENRSEAKQKLLLETTKSLGDIIEEEQEIREKFSKAELGLHRKGELEEPRFIFSDLLEVRGELEGKIQEADFLSSNERLELLDILRRHERGNNKK
ncbi:hypothetical protein AKJ62_01265 [candidate division MSBL1 archaeon SCGC-AAA259D14]|uniref:HTH hxlR-type domain-containing protein n=1 Tax=candidate division MSBL1 archaeon SCGC-AAA259D14 TaxID=1698261 RepID=A0A133U7T2_9EURY|nr:hypothetical protein AKJ62_01265 [candidate division MSBL1 archaeon SCGC-AAA259D14]